MSIYFWRENERPYGCFGQWYISSFTDGESTFNCCEQYDVYKSNIFNDYDIADKIMNEKLPKNQKCWDERLRTLIMISGIFIKKVLFVQQIIINLQNKELKKILLSTKYNIYEASPYDNIC